MEERLEQIEKDLQKSLPEAKRIIGLLNEYAELHPSSYIPSDYFFLLNNAVNQVAFELLPYKVENNQLSVYLLKRQDDDPFYASTWHFPGGIQRYNQTKEESLNNVFSELGLEIQPIDVLDTVVSTTKNRRRGPCNHILIASDMSGLQPKNGTWFSVNDLPDQFLDEHVPFVEILSANVSAS
ncbi:MAG: hypothetical protein O3B64_03175 [bacterium]|nr:hypothetical protein [bacterium]